MELEADAVERPHAGKALGYAGKLELGFGHDRIMDGAGKKQRARQREQGSRGRAVGEKGQ
jgi:hypothetical protein